MPLAARFDCGLDPLASVGGYAFGVEDGQRHDRHNYAVSSDGQRFLVLTQAACLRQQKMAYQTSRKAS
jgi:hypothetical protein